MFMTNTRLAERGVVPARLLLIRLVETQIDDASAELRAVPFSPTAGDIEPALAKSIELTNRINELSKDLRSLTSAYASPGATKRHADREGAGDLATGPPAAGYRPDGYRRSRHDQRSINEANTHIRSSIATCEPNRRLPGN